MNKQQMLELCGVNNKHEVRMVGRNEYGGIKGMRKTLKEMLCGDNVAITINTWYDVFSPNPNMAELPTHALLESVANMRVAAYNHEFGTLEIIKCVPLA